MKKWIRWQGLLAFIVITGVLAIFWIFFFDGLVRRAIEKTGTLIVGAEVDVNKVDVALSPLGITLRGLQVTNPDKPATNSMECGRIAFTLDGLNLFRRKVIINEMAVEGLRFDTQRKRPGMVRVKPPKEKRAEDKKTVFGMPLEKPDVKSILQKEQLESLQLIETSKADLQKKKADWQQRMKEMPDKSTVQGYEDRIKQIRKGKRDIRGIAEQAKELREVTRDIEKELDRVKEIRVAFSNDLAAAKLMVDRAEQAPGNDIRRLRDKYSLSPTGLANMTQLLFSDQISSWVRTGLLWYNRLQPIVERAKAQKKDVTVVKPLRGKGVDVRFREYRPLPDFLIDRTAVSAETAAGNLAGTIRNITPDQNILRLPTTFSLTGEKLKAANSISLTGALNHIDPARSQDTAAFAVQGFKLPNLVLSDDKDFPIAMQDALVDFNLNGSFTQALKATFSAKVNSAKMNIGGQESNNPFVQSIRSSLSKVNSFSLNADITGTLENYNMNISSDLDNILKNAVSSVVKEQSARLEQELKAAVQERTGDKLKELKESFTGLTDQAGKLENVQKQLNAILDDALKSAGAKLKLRR